MRKVVNIIIVGCIVLLQPSLWRGEGSVIEVWRLRQAISNKQDKLSSLKLRNKQLSDQIKYIKTNPDAIEDHARYNLGMIRKGESYYQVIMPIE